MNWLVKRDFNGFFQDLFSPISLFKNDYDFTKILNGRSDFEEDYDKYTIEIEMPGVKKDEINISLKNDTLTVSWSRKKENKKGRGKGKFEISEGSFTRSFGVEGANNEKIDANLKDGVLKIVLYKNESYKPIEIKIN